MPIFPYSGKTTLSGSTDSNVSALQNMVNQIQDVLLGMVQIDPSVKAICHFDNSLATHLAAAGAGSGAIRYWAGKFGAAGVLVEQGTTNLIPNPSAEADLTNWSAIDSSISLARDNTVAYSANNTTSLASFKLTGTGSAGLTYAKAAPINVNPGTNYSASVYAYSTTAAKAQIELAFTGGTPSTVTSSATTLTPNTWTRIRFENQNSGTGNNQVEVRLYVVQQAPTYAASSQLSTLSPTSTAAVTDGGMIINAGDLVMCAVIANPNGPQNHAWHMVTTGATGVSNAALRLDDSNAAPTFVTGTRFSRLAPAGGNAVLVTDNALVINAGDLVFCNLQKQGYGWHLVTTGATGANNAALRFDDSPGAPAYAGGSRLTRLVPVATAAVTDGAMTINAGDIVLCRTQANPTSGVYSFHVVTTGATGVNSSNLRLDGATAAPTFATGSRFSKLSPNATGNSGDMGATLTTGDFAIAYPTANPAAPGYTWGMITTGATGVANTSLRLSQATSDVINYDCAQLEQTSGSNSFADSFQGTGFSGALGSTSTRAATTLTYPTSGNVTAGAGTVAFWLYPLFGGGSNNEHMLFDMAVGPEQDRLRFSKDASNALNLAIYDTNGQLKQWLTGTMSFSRETWQHVAFTYSAGTVAIYLNGVSQSLTPSGSGTGQLTNLPTSMYLGSDFNGQTNAGAVFDDLVIANAALTADQIARMGTDSGPYLGLASARKGLDTAQGNATTDATPGNQTSIAHGLGVAPSIVLITERANGVVYLSASADSTSFYVKGSASAVNFDWRAFA